MRIIALVLVLLSVHAVRAEAEPQELSNLRAAVRDATDRLKKSNLSSARVFVKKGRDAIGKASAELDKRCSQLEGELGKRKATGCGRRYAGISQNKLPGNKWGPVESTQPGGGFTVAKCSDMPAKSLFPGLSATFKAKFESACGSKAVRKPDLHRRARWRFGRCGHHSPDLGVMLGQGRAQLREVARAHHGLANAGSVTSTSSVSASRNATRSARSAGDSVKADIRGDLSGLTTPPRA